MYTRTRAGVWGWGGGSGKRRKGGRYDVMLSLVLIAGQYISYQWKWSTSCSSSSSPTNMASVAVIDGGVRVRVCVEHVQNTS